MEVTQVAEMVQTLALEPGMRVLEIGARGAYHTGLLASHVGTPDLVTTIDLHTEITRPLLSPFQTVCVGNAEDVPSRGTTRACYDRIISTQDVQSIPFAWIDLLAPSGCVIIELRRPLAAVVVLLHKDDDGKGASGMILPIEASFRNPRSLNPPRNPGPVLCEIQDAVSPRLLIPRTPPLRDFAFSLMCHMPDACAYHAEQEDDPEGTLYTYLFHAGAFLRWGPQDVRGNRVLWQDLLRCVSDFQKAGRPRREQYTVRLGKDGHLVFSLPGWQWSLY